MSVANKINKKPALGMIPMLLKSAQEQLCGGRGEVDLKKGGWVWSMSHYDMPACIKYIWERFFELLS